MGEYVFDDALTGTRIDLSSAMVSASLIKDSRGEARPCPSLFFPGCSVLNYALPLVRSVYDLLAGAGQVEGISLLCCGKILDFEPEGKAHRASFEVQLCNHVAAAGVERIVAACPNCVAALRGALESDARVKHVEVVALPVVLAEMGYRLDGEIVQAMVNAELQAMEGVDTHKICVHDPCPDRDTGEFADGVRSLIPEGVLVEAAHIRNKSFCCGSILRAVGKFEKADQQARRRGEEASAVQASAITTACISCAYQLSMAQDVPVFHYLELLYNWRIDWRGADQYMKLRFLFEDNEEVGEQSGRQFKGLSDSVSMDGEGIIS